MSKANRLAFITPRFSRGATVGGAETLIKNLALKAAESGREVTLLTTCATDHVSWANEHPAERIEFEGIHVEFFPVNTNRNLRLFRRLDQAIGKRRTLSRDEEMLWLRHSVNSDALCEHIRANEDAYDRIIAGPYLFGLIHHALMLFPHKSVLIPCLHDESFAYLDVMKDLFRAVSGFMFNSEPERDLARRLYELPSGRLDVVGMGMDDFACAPDTLRREQGLTAPYLIYAGRRELLKGTPLLLDYVSAFRRRTQRDVKLVLTGSGRIDLPADLAEHVVDLGFVSEETKHNAMAGALAFCHPSTNESFGIVILESWMADRPVLVHVGSDVLTDHCRKSGGGLWFGNYPEFETELTLLLDDHDMANRMGNAGRTYVRNQYSWSAITEKMLAVLDRPLSV